VTIARATAGMRVANAARGAIPDALLDVSGRALYSPAATLTTRTGYYFLGVNPGESPDKQLHATITVRTDLDRLANGSLTEHGYLDEVWKNYAPGCAPIQTRGQQLFALLAGGAIEEGRALLRSTPTSNFVLQRSTSVVALEGRTRKSSIWLAEQYWPFHQAVIDEVQPIAVITHAVVMARGLARAFGLGEGQQCPSGWGGTLSTCYAWRLPEGPMLLAIPNLSRYMPDGPRALALMAFFREMLPQEKGGARAA
jgi:hypothetical protein